MATYFVIETVTREGMLTVKDAPERASGVVSVAAKYGVTVSEWFYTTGGSDFLMKCEAADEEAMAVFVMSLRRSGNVTVSVLRAYQPEQWAGLVERV